MLYDISCNITCDYLSEMTFKIMQNFALKSLEIELSIGLL